MTGRPIARYLLAACAVAILASGHTRAGEAARDAGEPPQRVEDQGARRAPPLNTLRDIGLALGACWAAHLPPLAESRPGMRVTVMLTFTRTGALQGEPRFTFVTPEATAETKARYQRVAVDAINTCTPLPFTDALGGAIAGRPTIFPFVDWRNQKGA